MISAVATGSFRYPFMMVGPRIQTSPRWLGPRAFPVATSIICTSPSKSYTLSKGDNKDNQMTVFILYHENDLASSVPSANFLLSSECRVLRLRSVESEFRAKVQHTPRSNTSKFSQRINFVNHLESTGLFHTEIVLACIID